MASDTDVNVITEGIAEILERQVKQGKILVELHERKDLNVTKVLAALEQVLDLQEAQREASKHQDRTLLGLEQRPILDIQGFARRLEEVADAITDLQAPVRISQSSRCRWIGVIVLCVVCGYLLCWGTVQWLPNGALPPGFSRGVPVKQKGRF